MNKDKIFHFIQYRRDMKRTGELLNYMINANEACKKAAEVNNNRQFIEQCTIFSACSAELDRIYKKWKIGAYAS